MLFSSSTAALTLSSGIIHSARAITAQRNLGILQSCLYTVPEPTIELLQTPAGPIWCITYAGMPRYHRQEWQARWLYEVALNAYHAQRTQR